MLLYLLFVDDVTNWHVITVGGGGGGSTATKWFVQSRLLCTAILDVQDHMMQPVGKESLDWREGKVLSRKWRYAEDQNLGRPHANLHP